MSLIITRISKVSGAHCFYLQAFPPCPRWPPWSLLSTLDFSQPWVFSPSCLCALLIILMLCTLWFCWVSLCNSIILLLVFLLPFSTSSAPLCTSPGRVLLKDTVGHALKQTGDLYNQGLYCWNLHSLTVLSASETLVTSFFPPWQHPWHSLNLIFTIS